MNLGRKVRLLVLGFSSSLLVGLLLVANCVNAASGPVIAEISLSFPYSLEGTDLIIQGITGYEGPFVEDGSNEEVVDVAALILYNAGKEMIDQAEITVQCDDKILEFSATKLPAGANLVTLERSGQVWIDSRIISCSAKVTLDKAIDLTGEQISVREVDMKTLEITSLNDKPLHNITIYHKTWTREMGIYLGGITYETHIDSLEPGQMLLLTPQCYASGGSRIVKIINTSID